MLPKNIVDKLLSGKLKKKYGLDTSVGSVYNIKRLQGANDIEAQYAAFKKRGLI